MTLDRVVGLEHLLQRLGQRLDGGRRGLLHEEVARLAVLEGVEHQVHRIVERHHEPGHVRIGDGQRLALPNLLDEQRDDRAARGHDVAVAGDAERASLFGGHARLGDQRLSPSAPWTCPWR